MARKTNEEIRAEMDALNEIMRKKQHISDIKAIANANISKLHKGKIVKQETRLKSSIANSGKIRTDITKKRLSEAGIGKKRPTEIKEKIKKTLTGRIHSPESIEKMKSSKQQMLPETKEKIRQARLGKKRPRGICPHCGGDFAVSVLTRHHFDKCKMKVTK